MTSSMGLRGFGLLEEQSITLCPSGHGFAAVRRPVDFPCSPADHLQKRPLLLKGVLIQALLYGSQQRFNTLQQCRFNPLGPAADQGNQRFLRGLQMAL